VLFRSGSFKTGQTISIRGFRVTETGVSIFKIVSEFVLGSNAVTYADGYAPITNYQHEMIENEKKRTIKLISPRLLDQFLREFNSLVTP
jgi:hypothetical protein